MALQWQSTLVNTGAVFCTGMLLLSIRATPPAYAQSGGYGGGGSTGGGYTGGSGSTSGGTIPGYPAPAGWNAQIRPDITPTGNIGDYDWTGLNIDSSWVNYDLTQGSTPTQTVYGGATTYIQPVGGEGEKASSTLDFTGTSTWKWLWTPPTDPVSNIQATLTQVPAQPLWILSKFTGDAFLDDSGDANAIIGLGGSGSLNDGLGGSEAFGLPGWAPADWSTMPRRKLMQADLQADQKTAILLTSPASHEALSGGVPYASGCPAQGGGTAGGHIDISEEVHPVLLTQPSPLGHPELGDGTNQYVYDTQSFFDGQNFVTGLLTIPAQGSIVGQNATSDDTNWLVGGAGSNSPGYLSWFVAHGIANPQSYITAAQGTGFGTQRSDPPPSNPYMGRYPFGTLGFVNMTASNDDFGPHHLNLLVKSAPAGTANFQTFFPGLATNHPSSDPPDSWDGSQVPNFFYYYSQLYTPLGKWEPDAGYIGSSNPGSSSHTGQTSPFNIYIHDDAYHNPTDGSTSVTGRVFALDPGSDSKVRFAGTFTSVKGIHRFIGVCAHEFGHQMVLSGVFDDAFGHAYNPANSTDGDPLDDGWESRHCLDPKIPDTTGAYGVQANRDVGDNEIIPDIWALHEVMLGHGTGGDASIDLWKKDWADGGLQYGRLLFATPYSKAPDFYWTFQPAPYTRADGSSINFPSTTIRNTTDLQNAVDNAFQQVTNNPAGHSKVLLDPMDLKPYTNS